MADYPRLEKQLRSYLATEQENIARELPALFVKTGHIGRNARGMAAMNLIARSNQLFELEVTLNALTGRNRYTNG